MKPINVCIVVFNRYDLLANLIESIRRSILTPRAVWIIDRGNDQEKLDQALGHGIDGVPIEVVPLEGQSLAAAWNWFMKNVPEDRVITSDDIEFLPETLGEMSKHPGVFVGLDDNKRSSHFACFMVRDECIEKVGYFDEGLSPNYVYFEDCDYKRRMVLAGVPIDGVFMHHGLAQSWEKKTLEQQNDHHDRFRLAERNYIKKWGGLPDRETYTSPQPYGE